MDDLVMVDLETRSETSTPPERPRERAAPAAASPATVASQSSKQRTFATPSEERAFIRKHPCVNPRCTTHADHRPPQETVTWPTVMKHPRLRESASEPQRWIDMEGNDVTDTLPQTAAFYRALPKDDGTCHCDEHQANVTRFEQAIAECDFVRRIVPELQKLARPNAVQYGPRGWAHEILTNLLPKGAATTLKGFNREGAKFLPQYSRRWRWCVACLLRPSLKRKHNGWRDVWVVSGYVNDDFPWLPMWSAMVPPHGLPPSETKRRTADDVAAMCAFFDATPGMGTRDNDDGVFISAKKVDDAQWLREGGAASRALLIKYGVNLPIVKEKAPYFKAPYGNYKELHTDPEMRAAFARGWAKMVEWGMIDATTGPLFDTIPMFYVLQQKDDGSVKERGIQDAAASGLNDILSAMVCILVGLDDIQSELQSGDYVWTRDLTNAFWHWAYNCRFALLFGSRSPEGKDSLLRSLLMGISNSPAIQQFFVIDLCEILIRRGHRRMHPYLDDFNSGDTKLRALLAGQDFDDTTRRVGLVNAEDKAGGPGQDGVVSLGRKTDTTAFNGNGRSYVGDERLDRYIYSKQGCTVRALLDLIDLGAAHLPMGAIAKLAGRITHIAPQIWSGKAHQRALYEPWVQFAGARQLEDDEDYPTPPPGWRAEAPAHIREVLGLLRFSSGKRQEFEADHPILNFWFDDKKRKTVDCYDPTFPCKVTRRLRDCLQWWHDHAKERNGVPLGLLRPEGARGRLRPELVVVDNAFIDEHSRTPNGFQVISTDAATHGDADQAAATLPRCGVWWGKSERYETIYDEETKEKYGIFGLEGGGVLEGFRRLAPLIAEPDVVFRGDNEGGVRAVNKGMCRNDDFQDLIELIYEESWIQQKSFCCIWCCTHCMWLSDGISRGTIKSASCDYMLLSSEYERIVCLLKKRPTIDGFANPSGDNSHCDTWCSLRDNYFAKDLRGHHCWLNPEFLLIMEALEWWLKAKAAAPECTSCTVIVPVYDSRPWERLLMQHFKLVHTYPANERLFTTRAATVYATAAEGLDVQARPRVCIGPTRWPVQVWHCA
jgi:hypothetical protein